MSCVYRIRETIRFHTVMFTKNSRIVLNGTTIVGRAERKGGIYVLCITRRSATERATAADDGSAMILNF